MTEQQQQTRRWEPFQNDTVHFYMIGTECFAKVTKVGVFWGAKIQPLNEYPSDKSLDNIKAKVEREIDAFLERAGLIERPALPDDVAEVVEELSFYQKELHTLGVSIDSVGNYPAPLLNSFSAGHVSDGIKTAIDIITAQAAELAALKAENEKLREFTIYVFETCTDPHYIRKALKALGYKTNE